MDACVSFGRSETMACPPRVQRSDSLNAQCHTRPAHSPGNLVPDRRLLYDVGFRHRNSFSPRRCEFRVRRHIWVAPGSRSVALCIDVGFWSDLGFHCAAHHGGRRNRRLHPDQGNSRTGACAGESRACEAAKTMSGGPSSNQRPAPGTPSRLALIAFWTLWTIATGSVVYAFCSEFVFAWSSLPIGKYDWTVEYAVIRRISLSAAILMVMVFRELERTGNRIRFMFWLTIVLLAFWRAIPRL